MNIIDQFQGIKATSSVEVEKDRNNLWVVKVYGTISFKKEGEGWKEYKYESFAVDRDLSLAYKDALEQLNNYSLENIYEPKENSVLQA